LWGLCYIFLVGLSIFVDIWGCGVGWVTGGVVVCFVWGMLEVGDKWG